MKIVLKNVKAEHYKLLRELAKVLAFKIVKVKLTEGEEDQALLFAMEEVKDEPNATQEEVLEFEQWLKSAK